MSSGGAEEASTSCRSRGEVGPIRLNGGCTRVVVRFHVLGIKLCHRWKPGRPARNRHKHRRRRGGGDTQPQLPPGLSINGAVAELRARLETDGSTVKLLQQGGEPFDHAFLERWLQAKGDIDLAASEVRAHAAWRARTMPSGRIEEAKVANELAARKAFLQGCDSAGRPVMVVLARNHNMHARNVDETKLFICYVLDAAIASADLRLNPHGQILCLLDLSGLHMANLDVKALQAIFELLQAHYPEQLGGLWFLNAPFIFWGLWRMVSPFIKQEATRQKIQFLGGADCAERLRNAIPPQVLPAEYGGDAPLVPVDQAVARLAAQRSAAAGGSGVLPSTGPPGAQKGKSRSLAALGAAGRAVGGWAASSWALAKRKAGEARMWAPPVPRLWGGLKKGEVARKKMAAKAPRPVRAASLRLAHQGSALLAPVVQTLLAPNFLLAMLRTITENAAKALLWAWKAAYRPGQSAQCHAPVRRQQTPPMCAATWPAADGAPPPATAPALAQAATTPRGAEACMQLTPQGTQASPFACAKAAPSKAGASTLAAEPASTSNGPEAQLQYIKHPQGRGAAENCLQASCAGSEEGGQIANSMEATFQASRAAPVPMSDTLQLCGQEVCNSLGEGSTTSVASVSGEPECSMALPQEELCTRLLQAFAASLDAGDVSFNSEVELGSVLSVGLMPVALPSVQELYL